MHDIHDVTSMTSRLVGALLALTIGIALGVTLGVAAPQSATAVEPGTTGAVVTAAVRDAATRSGSIVIDAHQVGDDGATTRLAGDGYSLVRIADADLDAAGQVDGWHMRDGFSRFERDWSSLTPSQLNEAAADIDAYVTAHHAYDLTATTDTTGRLVFDNLTAGIYLISRTSVAQANRHYTCDPFLVSVPQLVDGTPTMDVTAEPKFGDDDVLPPDPNPTPQPTPKPGASADTGSSVLVFACAAVLLAVGAAMLIVLVSGVDGRIIGALRDRRRTDHV